jgi:hypothetical protein
MTALGYAQADKAEGGALLPKQSALSEGQFICFPKHLPPRLDGARRPPQRKRRKRIRRRQLQGLEEKLCCFQIGSVEPFGEAVVDGLKNLDGSGSIFPPDPEACCAKSGT